MRDVINFSLRKTYFPLPSDNLMSNEGDLEQARDYFIKKKPSNLVFLLEKRFNWMNDYLPKNHEAKIFELGCGAGFSKFFISHKNLTLTDVSQKTWVDLYVDALDLPFEDLSVDAFICSHMIHHLANPKKFFTQALKKLKPGGVIIISEIETSYFMRFLLRLMRHEGWSYDVDVFSLDTVANDPKDPWSANCAIPQLLFKNQDQFILNFPETRINLNQLTECLIFPLSGGVIAKSPTVHLPRFLLNLIHKLDQLLIFAFPAFFAMGRRVVIQKK